MGIQLSAEELFQIAAQMEAGGQSYYLELADRTSDPKVRELLDALASEEEKHHKQFIEYYEQATQKDWTLSKVDEETADYINALLKVRMFPPDKDVSKEITTVHNVKDGIKIALSLEKDSLLFYRELLEVIGSDLCPAIKMIINEERSHISRLQEMLETTPA